MGLKLPEQTILASRENLWQFLRCVLRDLDSGIMGVIWSNVLQELSNSLPTRHLRIASRGRNHFHLCLCLWRFCLGKIRANATQHSNTRLAVSLVAFQTGCRCKSGFSKCPVARRKRETCSITGSSWDTWNKLEAYPPPKHRRRKKSTSVKKPFRQILGPQNSFDTQKRSAPNKLLFNSSQDIYPKQISAVDDRLRCWVLGCIRLSLEWVRTGEVKELLSAGQVTCCMTTLHSPICVVLQLKVNH